MKKITDLPILLVVFSMAMMLVPPPFLYGAATMDNELILAMEEIKKEMRENGAPAGESPAAGLDLPPADLIPGSPEGEITPEPPAVEAPVPLKEELPIAPPTAAAGLSLQEQLEKRGSLKFVDEDIRVVLRSLAKAYGFNVTLAPEVQGKVTVDFTDVKIIDALQTILVDLELGYRISGNILRVTSLEKIQAETTADAAREAAGAQKAMEEAKKRQAEEQAEPLVVKVFELQHIDATDAKEAIQTLLSPRGKVMVLKTQQFKGFKWSLADKIAAMQGEEAEEFSRSKTLIIQDIATVLNRLDPVIKEIDKKPCQILIDAKILEVPVKHEFRLGINWTEALNQWNVGANDMQAILGKSYRRTSDSTDKDTHDWGSGYEKERTWVEGEDTKEYDRGEAKDGDTSGRMSYSGSGYPTSGGGSIKIPDLYDYTIPDSETGGPFQQNVAWRANVGNDVRTSGWADEFYTRIEDSETKRNFDDYLYGISDTLTKLSTASETYSAILNAADFNLMLSAMKTDSNIVLLSNPRILVHENYRAKIFIGKEFPILKTEVGEYGVGGTSLEEWKEIGILLAVIPQVRRMGDGTLGINMIIHPEVSIQDGWAPAFVYGQGFVDSAYPVINTRGTDSNVTVPDGDTIVIGGLIDSRSVDEEDKIPLLGDIPILGYFFKEEHTKLEKTNILIFITARIVTEDFEISPYEKLMLEKSPPDALEDVRYVEDDQVRSYLYKSAKEPEPPQPEAEGEEDGSTMEEKEGNKGDFGGRVLTKAMKRSRR
ncbi:MAG: hypothetical protein V1789_06090 [PVC group bacterium]